MFASSFAAFDPSEALQRYYEKFEEDEQMIEEGVTEVIPETEEDVMRMLEAARQAGAIR